MRSFRNTANALIDQTRGYNYIQRYHALHTPLRKLGSLLFLLEADIYRIYLRSQPDSLHS